MTDSAYSYVTEIPSRPLYLIAKWTSTGQWAKQYWSPCEAVLVVYSHQYWSTQWPVLVDFTPHYSPLQ